MQNLSDRPEVYLKRVTDWQDVDKISYALVSIWNKIYREGLIAQDDFTGIKITFGEEGTSGYIKSEWLKDFIALLKQKTQNLFFIETNTLYRERRSNAVGHLHVATSHGYSIDKVGIPIIIADGLFGRDGKNIPIKGTHFDNVRIANAVCESDSIICLSHVTGHMQAGFAGCLKNIGMGCASRQGKLLQHSGTLPEITVEKCIGCGLCMNSCPANAIGIKKKKAILVKEKCIGCGECTVVCRYDAIEIKYDENAIKFQEKMVEYALGVYKVLKGKMVFINFLNNITKNCDCMSINESPLVQDIGIIGGKDPVAVDKASMDMIGIDIFRQAFPELDPLIQIRHAEKIKLGSGEYTVIEI